MTDGPGLSERDIDAIARRVQQLAQPTIQTGADADVVRRVMREEIQRNRDDKRQPDEQALRRIVREEIDRDRERNREDCRRMIHEEANRIIDAELPRVFRDLDMSIDPQDINETRKKLGRLFEWQASAHEWRGTFVSTIVKSAAIWFLGVVMAGLAYAGLKGGGTH